MKIIKQNIKKSKLNLIISISFFDVKNKLDKIKEEIIKSDACKTRKINWINLKELIYEFVVRSEIDSLLKTLEIKNNIIYISEPEIKTYFIIPRISAIYCVQVFVSTDIQNHKIESSIKRIKLLNKNFSNNEIIEELIRETEFSNFSEGLIRIEMKNILNVIQSDESSENNIIKYLKTKESSTNFLSDLRQNALKRIKIKLLLEKIVLINQVLLKDEDKISVLIKCIQTEEINIDAIFKTFNIEIQRRSLRLLNKILASY